MAQKLDGNWDDVTRVVRNIKEGMVWKNAKVADAFLAVEDAWYERNKALFYDWAEKGIPTQQDNISLIDRKPDPLQVISTPDGKVWAVYRGKEGLYREEIESSSILAEAAAPTVEVPAKKKADKTW